MTSTTPRHPFSTRTSANRQSMFPRGEPDDLIATGPEIAIAIRAPDAFAVARPVCRDSRQGDLFAMGHGDVATRLQHQQFVASGRYRQAL